MKRFLGFSLAMFFALTAIALVGGDSGAVAGHGCHGGRRCHGGLLARRHACHGRHARCHGVVVSDCCVEVAVVSHDCGDCGEIVSSGCPGGDCGDGGVIVSEGTATESVPTESVPVEAKPAPAEPAKEEAKPAPVEST